MKPTGGSSNFTLMRRRKGRWAFDPVGAKHTAVKASTDTVIKTRASATAACRCEVVPAAQPTRGPGKPGFRRFQTPGSGAGNAPKRSGCKSLSVYPAAIKNELDSYLIIVYVSVNGFFLRVLYFAAGNVRTVLWFGNYLLLFFAFLLKPLNFASIVYRGVFALRQAGVVRFLRTCISSVTGRRGYPSASGIRNF